MTDRITVIVSAQAKETGKHGASALAAPFGGVSEIELDTQRITDEVSKLLRCIDGVQASEKGNFEVSEVVFKLGINAKGKLAILFASGEAGIDAAITVTIKRTAKT
jgi:hypothetical protein